jgi:hypothetical protein
MGVGAFLEPLVVVGLLAGGTILNRDRPGSGRRRAYEKGVRSSSSSPKHSFAGDALEAQSGRRWSGDDDDSMPLSPWSVDSSGGSSTTLLSQGDNGPLAGPRWRERTLRLFKWEKKVLTPNTEVFEDRLLSRVLRRLPFLVEAWYWALIYWVSTNRCHISRTYIVVGAMLKWARHGTVGRIPWVFTGACY